MTAFHPRQNRSAMSRAASHWVKIIIAVAAGNAVYFAIEPRLPYAAQHHAWLTCGSAF
jgi:hypothetical protein